MLAVVRGTRMYRVQAEWDADPLDGYIDFDCDCPAFERVLECKHVWAVFLSIQADGRVEPRPSPASVTAPSPAEEWLRSLPYAASPEARDPWAGLLRPAERIRYLLDLDLALHGEDLPLVCVRSQRKKDGSLGVERPYRPRFDGSDDPLDPVDRQLIAALRGAGDAEDFDPYGYRHRSQHYTLQAELRDELLPRLCATGRLHWRRWGELGGPLSWDTGPPWRVKLELTRDDGRIALEGRLTRAGEQLSLQRPLQLFESGIVIIDEHVARFDPRGAMHTVVALRRAGRLELPVERESELIARAAEYCGGALGSVPGHAWREVAPTPRLSVRAGSAGARSRQLPCVIDFNYAGLRVRPEEQREVLVLEATGELVRRDFDAERAALAHLLEIGARRAKADANRDQHASIPVKQLPVVVQRAIAAGWTVEAEGRLWRSSTGTSARLRSGIDWFELEGGLEFGDQVAPFPAILEAVRKGTDQVVLGDGSLGMLPEEWLQRWSLLELAKDNGADGLRFDRHQGWLLDAFLAEREGVATDASFDEYRARLSGFEGVAARREPAGFQGTLREYQREGLGWFGFLQAMGFGGCLADDMGLGKTIQVLALLEARRARRLRKGETRRPSLVVAPRSLVFNWLDEAARFAPKLRTLDYTGPDRRARSDDLRRAHLVVTTYGTLRRDIVDLKERDFDYLVLDEAQAIKNPSSLAAKAARLLRSDHRLALSGTPIENHLGELWSLLEFLNPGMLGRSRAFERFLGANKSGAGADLPALARALRPFFLRRTKEEVLDDLPEKTEQALVIELGRKDRKRYDELRDHFRDALLAREGEVGLGRMRIQVLEALLRLRQCACHPALIDPGLAAEPSAKLEALLPRLEEIAAEGHKALVFSQFTKLLGIVRARLDELGIPYEYLDGRTRKRKECVERFQADSGCPLFLISLKAGGHGLNLTAADYVFLLDPWWNPAVESQAIDRAHRMGRTRPVCAYRLIARDTVEDRVLELQQTKRELAATLLGEGQGVLRDMTRDDLERLLS